ncbi:MAG: M15 family metallopeptidase [Pseudomonadota bacterium]
MLLKRIPLLITLLTLSFTANADLLRLKQTYPDHIQAISNQFIIWSDGTKMPVQEGKPNKTQQEKLDAPALIDQVNDVCYTYRAINPSTFNPQDDPGRIRYEPFFRKMYGNSKEEVTANLITLFWMPKYFGQRYPLQVTTVNGVDKKLMLISHDLEDLVAIHPDYLPFLDNPGGTFSWRVIANTNRLSPHSFGMTIDINSNLSDYWQWDLQKEGAAITEDAKLTYRNRIPEAIVAIFEKYGFIWGGKWHHYDTMHFEYRPELFCVKS